MVIRVLVDSKAIIQNKANYDEEQIEWLNEMRYLETNEEDDEEDEDKEEYQVWAVISEPNHPGIQFDRKEFLGQDQYKDILDRLIELKLIERSNRPPIPYNFIQLYLFTILF